MLTEHHALKKKYRYKMDNSNNTPTTMINGVSLSVTLPSTTMTDHVDGLSHSNSSRRSANDVDMKPMENDLNQSEIVIRDEQSTVPRESKSIAANRHGFIDETEDSEIDVKVMRRRELKWIDMLRDDNWDDFMVNHYQKVRSRCRKGIPASMRPKAWFYLCGAKYIMEEKIENQKENEASKFELLCNHTGDNKWTDDIEKDLHRNFPNHELFGGRYKQIGQKELFHVLKAYSVYDPKVGYCQAQAPVAALLLMNMHTEHAFWCFVSICDRYLSGYYSSGMEQIQLDGDILYGLLKKVSPAAYKHLKSQNVEPILYMTEWFLCAFTRTLPWPTVLRIWDMFMCEGIKVMFKVALVLLKNSLGSGKDRKQCPTMYETLMRLKELPDGITNEQFLIQEVLTLDIGEDEMKKEHRKQAEKRRKNNVP